jgi:hypothetical protein
LQDLHALSEADLHSHFVNKSSSTNALSTKNDTLDEIFNRHGTENLEIVHVHIIAVVDGGESRFKSLEN